MAFKTNLRNMLIAATVAAAVAGCTQDENKYPTLQFDETNRVETLYDVGLSLDNVKYLLDKAAAEGLEPALSIEDVTTSDLNNDGVDDLTQMKTIAAVLLKENGVELGWNNGSSYSGLTPDWNASFDVLKEANGGVYANEGVVAAASCYNLMGDGNIAVILTETAQALYRHDAGLEPADPIVPELPANTQDKYFAANGNADGDVDPNSREIRYANLLVEDPVAWQLEPRLHVTASEKAMDANAGKETVSMKNILDAALNLPEEMPIVPYMP